MAQVTDDEERRHNKGLETKQRQQTKESVLTSDSVGGLGLNGLRQTRQGQVDAEPQTPLTAPPVVVNVGGGIGDSKTATVADLAAYVVNGDELGRDSRMRVAVGVLQATASTDEERRVLAARLDEAVAKRLLTAPPSDQSPFARAARVTFDKLSSFWKGE